MATSLIDPDCIIPGVNNNLDFVAWLTKDKRIKFHNVLVKESPLGGIGLFYNSSKPSTGNSELLRIKLKYDYTNLLEKLNKLSPGNSAIVKLTLSTIRPSTETSILQSYFIAFKICTIINGIDNDEVLGDIVPYLNILCNTKVDRLDLTGSSNTSSRFLSKFNRIEERQLAVYEELMNALKEEKYQVSDDFKFEDYKQIEAVIRSRVLEIPHALSDEDDEEVDDDSYVSNVTLVPFLDFVNHSNEVQKNSYFDVDKETGEILLLLKDEAKLSNGEEVTICYSPNENIQSMISSYGFIPDASSASAQLFEIIIPGEFLNKYLNSYNGNTKQDELQNYAYILKWLQIFPLVQLVLLNNKVYINYFSNLLPLAFISGLKYNANWHKVIGEAFQDEAEKSETLKILKLQESEYDIINGVEDQRAVSLNGEYPNISNILEISDMENEEDFLKLQAECTKMIHKYCTEAISEKVDFLLSEMSLEEEKSLLKGYLEKEINIFRNLVERFENKEDLTLPEELSKEEWEYERTNPRFYY